MKNGKYTYFYSVKFANRGIIIKFEGYEQNDGYIMVSTWNEHAEIISPHVCGDLLDLGVDCFKTEKKAIDYVNSIRKREFDYIIRDFTERLRDLMDPYLTLKNFKNKKLKIGLIKRKRTVHTEEII